MHKGRGTLGKLMNDPSLYNHLSSTAGKMDALVTSIQQGQGTMGKLVASDEMYNKAGTAIDHVNNVSGRRGTAERDDGQARV